MYHSNKKSTNKSGAKSTTMSKGKERYKETSGKKAPKRLKY